MTVAEDRLAFTGSNGAALTGDLYRPSGPGHHPVMVAVPGGAWLRGDKAQLSAWGRYLAAQGIAVFAIDYTRSTNGPAFPDNVQDVGAATRFLSQQSDTLGLDRARFGLFGASAGAHLAALAALRQDPEDDDAVAFKTLVAVYGVYDLVSHWQADLDKNATRGADPTERMMGCTPFDDQAAFFLASPLRQITYGRNSLKTLLIWGDADRDVLPAQSEAFARALRQAGFFVRTQSVPGAGHFWFSEEAPGEPGSFSATVAPLLLKFLKQHLSDDRTRQ